MKCVVTGAAGFIGSRLTEQLLRLGHEVVGVDCFVPYYPKGVKYQNLTECLRHPRFCLHHLDLRYDPVEPVLAGAEAIFHLAAMPGLTKSWSDFDGYWTCNVQATHKLLQGVRSGGPPLRLFILASTSSVYGNYASGDESLPTRPVSPYGVTKLAAENLCRAFAEAHGLPLVTLRYFSVYGPRQRPDMGYHRFIDAILKDEPVVVYGDGRQVRGNTFVDDCVDATVAALGASPGEVFNVGGGETASVWDVLQMLEGIAKKPVLIKQEPARPGDQRYTIADTTKLATRFGWKPRISLQDGLARQWEWQCARLAPTQVGDGILV